MSPLTRLKCLEKLGCSLAEGLLKMADLVLNSLGEQADCFPVSFLPLYDWMLWGNCSIFGCSCLKPARKLVWEAEKGRHWALSFLKENYVIPTTGPSLQVSLPCPKVCVSRTFQTSLSTIRMCLPRCEQIFCEILPFLEKQQFSLLGMWLQVGYKWGPELISPQSPPLMISNPLVTYCGGVSNHSPGPFVEVHPERRLINMRLLWMLLDGDWSFY